jgi:hypothetical protein
MEYPKNTVYYPNSTLNRRVTAEPRFPVAHACIEKPPANCLDGASLAMVYSPCQHFEKLYEPMEGLHCGTIFCKLYMPFTGNRK